MLWITILKAIGTLAVVVIISEVQKRSNVLGAAIAALPFKFRAAGAVVVHSKYRHL